MLQQTTVSAVVPYFERFLKAFPTLVSLAEADEQDVLALWSGLGYYRRAKHLHQSARDLVQSYGGIPNDPDVWSELPGVGRYILGAVLSQAFERKLPIVEANSMRVLSRLLGLREDPRTGAGNKLVWSAAEALLPNSHIGEYNQALMELGALICTAESPKCISCPVAKWCVANQNGLQASIPPKQKRKIVESIVEIGVVIRSKRKILLGRRPRDSERWADMWEIPHGEKEAEETDEAAAIRIARQLTGLNIEPGAEIATIQYSVTRFRFELKCLAAKVRSSTSTSTYYSEISSIDLESACRLPIASVQKKLFKTLLDTQVEDSTRKIQIDPRSSHTS